MRIIGHGIDLVEVARILEMLERHGDRFVERCYTPREAEYAKASKRRVEHLAARFAAKEAVLKALGTGLRDGMAWTDIEIVPLPTGQPTIEVRGKVGEMAYTLGIAGWLVSMSHTDRNAIASVIAVGSD
jgi:holo-[acyl-carrier protein] synthase